MTYKIRHENMMKSVRMAAFWNNADYVVSSSTAPVTRQYKINTLVQASGMGLTISSDSIILESKRYILYFKPGISTGTSTLESTVFFRLNGVTITGEQFAASTDDNVAGAVVFTSPIPFAYASIDANQGDILTVWQTFTAGSGVTQTCITPYTKGFILEVSR
jgi:hypothetical protein